jgi:hypothetical protein
MTDEIYDALDAAKSIFDLVDPSPQTALSSRIWIFPEEEADIDLSTLPAMVISQVINRESAFWRNTLELIRHEWEIEALLFLSEGPITQEDSRGATAEETIRYWPKAIAKAFYAPNRQKLMDNAVMIGATTGQLLRYHIGQIAWQSNIFFGIRLVIPVEQVIEV